MKISRANGTRKRVSSAMIAGGRMPRVDRYLIASSNMADAEASPSHCSVEENPSKCETLARSEKRKSAKKLKRKQKRKDAALKERAEEETRLNDPEEQLKIRLKEQEEAERMERDRKEFEERERLWLEAAAARKAEEDARRKLLEESQGSQERENGLQEEEDWEYVDDGPAEIIWQGNEIIVKKKKVRVAKRSSDQEQGKEEDADRPTSNPLPPQSAVFAAYRSTSSVSAQQVLESVAQQMPNFGTEQDKAHCPFHIKTGACRFGSRCSRVHFHPDKSCTLLIKNMYSGPGIAWEQDEGLEYTDEEVEHCYEEFYEDVHTEFLKFGEIVNFKVCRNGSFHLRGNVYVHYKSLESAFLAYASLNGRYFAGKQITCEFVGVTRWKVAICGEYMKSKLKTCSRGSACNFLHCFHNPGGDYEWADWDNPPPKYWVKKMVALFGHSDESEYDRHMELNNGDRQRNSSRRRTENFSRYQSKRSRFGRDPCNSGGESSDENSAYCSLSNGRRSNSKGKERSFCDGFEQSEERENFNCGKYKSRDHDSTRYRYAENRDRLNSYSRTRLSSRKVDMNSPDGHDHSEEDYSSDRLEGKDKTCECDSGGGYSDVDENRFNGRSMRSSSSHRKEVSVSYDNVKLEVNGHSSDDERYQMEDTCHHRHSGGDYPGTRRDCDGHHSSRQAPLTRRKQRDFPDEHGKYECESDSEVLKPYNSKHVPCHHSHGGEYDDEKEGQNHRGSRKNVRSRSRKEEMSFHDKSGGFEKYDSDDHKQYNRRYRSQDRESSRDYDVSKSRQSSHSSSRVHTRRKRAMGSPSDIRESKEQKEGTHRRVDSYDPDDDYKRYKQRVLEVDDMNFSSYELAMGQNKKESDTSQHGLSGTICSASSKSHGQATSEESGGPPNNDEDATSKQSQNCHAGSSSRRRRSNKHRRNVGGEVCDSETDTPKKTRSARKRSRSQSQSPIRHSSKSRRVRRHDGRR